MWHVNNQITYRHNYDIECTVVCVGSQSYMPELKATFHLSSERLPYKGWLGSPRYFIFGGVVTLVVLRVIDPHHKSRYDYVGWGVNGGGLVRVRISRLCCNWLIVGVVSHHLCSTMVVPVGHRWRPLLLYSLKPSKTNQLQFPFQYEESKNDQWLLLCLAVLWTDTPLVLFLLYSWHSSCSRHLCCHHIFYSLILSECVSSSLGLAFSDL